MTIYTVTINGREVCRTDNLDSFDIQRDTVAKTLQTMRLHYAWSDYSDGTDFDVQY